uniref:Uncharacterized protein n=1 Tax=Kalanchoe fedtschenkoi TaxID=63787 RepID=A0A7N0TZV7_KALFE
MTVGRREWLSSHRALVVNTYNNHQRCRVRIPPETLQVGRFILEKFLNGAMIDLHFF